MRGLHNFQCQIYCDPFIKNSVVNTGIKQVKHSENSNIWGNDGHVTCGDVIIKMLYEAQICSLNSSLVLSKCLKPLNWSTYMDHTSHIVMDKQMDKMMSTRWYQEKKSGKWYWWSTSHMFYCTLTEKALKSPIPLITWILSLTLYTLPLFSILNWCKMCYMVWTANPHPLLYQWPQT